WIGRHCSKDRVLQSLLRAKERAHLRPVRAILGVSRYERGHRAACARRQPSEERSLFESLERVPGAEIMFGKEVSRGKRARIAPLRCEKGTPCPFRIAAHARLDPAHKEGLGRRSEEHT